MLDLWRGRITPRQVLNLIDRLPRHSHYVAALADDDELADQLADQDDEDKGPPPAPPLTEFGPVEERLTLIADRLGELLRAFAAANSKKKPPPYKPLARPVTARQRARRRRREAKHELVTARLAEAAASGRPTMADLRADSTSMTTSPRRRG